MSRTPTAFGSFAARRRRHAEMVRLRERGATLQGIAVAVGLWAESTVRYHLRGDCHCYKGSNGARAQGDADDPA